MWRQLARLTNASNPRPCPQAGGGGASRRPFCLNARVAILIFGLQLPLMFFNYANKGINLLPERCRWHGGGVTLKIIFKSARGADKSFAPSQTKRDNYKNFNYKAKGCQEALRRQPRPPPSRHP